MIRRAEPRDLPRLVQMGRLFHAEAGWLDLIPWNDAGAADALGTMIGRPDCVVIVGEEVERVVSMAAAIITPTWFNPGVLSAQEWFWYVEPRARHGLGAQMLDRLEEDVRAAGAATFTMLAVHDLRADALARVYARRGYRPAERTFMRRL